MMSGNLTLSSLPLPPTSGMLSLEGRCKTLDASADGYVRAEACGVALLIPILASGMAGGKAAADREMVPSLLAIILGDAVNQDGRSSSLTAPNGPAQQRVMWEALSSVPGRGLSTGSVCALQVRSSVEGACVNMYMSRS